MKVTIIKADGWEGLYVNDKLVKEDHRIDLEDVITHCFKDVEFSEKWCNDSWLENLGYLPKHLDDVVLE